MATSLVAFHLFVKEEDSQLINFLLNLKPTTSPPSSLEDSSLETVQQSRILCGSLCQDCMSNSVKVNAGESRFKKVAKRLPEQSRGRYRPQQSGRSDSTVELRAELHRKGETGEAPYHHPKEAEEDDLPNWEFVYL